MESSRPATNQSQKGVSPPMHVDDVYPVHVFDDTKLLRSILMTWTLYFNDVLDADKLRVSLSRLLEIGDWRKIGGRLKLNAQGKLEIHVPRPFTDKRPAFSYSVKQENIAVEDHAVAKRFPKPKGHVSICSGPQEFCDLATSSAAPVTLEDLLAGDTPQLSVHITSFTNTTFIGLSWPHTLMDVMGQQALLHAWSLVLTGREAEVPRVLGARDDILCTLIDAGGQKEKEHVLKAKQLDGPAIAKFGASFDMLTGPAPETRTVCLSKRAITKLRSEVLQHLPSPDVDTGEKLFVSDGDVLTAWIVRAVATALPHPSPVTALHTMNARFRLPFLKTANGVYLQNMLINVFSLFTPDIARGPMGLIALYNRQHLMQQATEAQVLASLREQRLAGDTTPLLYSDADALLVPFTDWTRAEIFRVADFGSAVIRAGESTQTRWNPSGTPVAHHASARRVNAAARLFVSIMGTDHGGNTWLTVTLPRVVWEKVERSLEELEQLE